ncbi:DM13 domain-containing protein [Nocardia thailandica]|uniref:DM13 domain-containing protein n=1 Tax=Nocardia thailandica TaxID=257275 RepID=A0ABW6PUZ3_9NOCA|nr:DM13 domain-containing protein [Nocardia thailandica]
MKPRTFRSRRRPVLLTVAAVLVVALAFGLYLFQPWRLFTTTRVDEPPVATATAPAPGATAAPALPSGTFVSHEHETSGAVTIQRAATGGYVLRITDLRTSDGPALHVYLSDQPVLADDWHNADDGRYLDLGRLKGNEGNQNYEIPLGTDPSEWASVSIWCARFHVSFGAAALRA